MISQKIKIWTGLFLLTIVTASGLGFAYGDQSNLYRGLEPLNETARTSAAASTLTAEDALTTVPVGSAPVSSLPVRAAPTPSVTVSLPVPRVTPTVELAPGETSGAPCDTNSVPVIKEGKITGCTNKNVVQSASISAPAVSCQAQGKLTYIGADTATLKYGQCIGN